MKHLFYDNSSSVGHILIAVKSVEGLEFFEDVPEWAALLRV